MEKLEHLHSVGENEKQCSLYGKKAWNFPKTFKIEPLYDPAILLLGIYPEKIIIRNEGIP